MTEFQHLATKNLNILVNMVDKARNQLQEKASQNGWIDDSEQYATHTFSWISTTVEALKQMLAWSKQIEEEGRFGAMEQLLLQICFGEYTAQVLGGIPMSQGEMARFSDIGVELGQWDQEELYSLHKFVVQANCIAARKRLVKLMLDNQGSSTYGYSGLSEEIEEIRDQIKRFSDQKIVPSAQRWHINNDLIPMEIVQELSEMGIFGLTIPDEYDGAGLPKTAMCVVSEELSRGHLGTGSLATRSEIVAELVRYGGNSSQKQKWLPKIASGEILPAAVFTEPSSGSDLGSINTRAEKHGGHYRIYGSKTWITHAARANFMSLLVRTNPNSTDYKGLSMLLAEKRAGDESNPFPDEGISGSEIEVIGYRGMKEYSLNFDGFQVNQEGLLGAVEGRGFRQLMETFESARIQTAARAIGVAQSALDVALEYASERRQFGKRLVGFPRVAAKLAMMAVEIMTCRQMTYFAARQKDSGCRCDLEAGMAKLIAARTAWSAADNAVQIHGGNGFASECLASRILCDARILSIFEGASEIQAEVIASRLLSRKLN